MTCSGQTWPFAQHSPAPPTGAAGGTPYPYGEAIGQFAQSPRRPSRSQNGSHPCTCRAGLVLLASLIWGADEGKSLGVVRKIGSVVVCDFTEGSGSLYSSMISPSGRGRPDCRRYCR